MLAPVSVHMSMSIYLQPVLLGICSLVFGEILRSDRNLETEKNGGNGCSLKILLCPKRGRKDAKWVHSKASLSFQYILQNNLWSYNSLFFCKNSYLRKFFFINYELKCSCSFRIALVIKDDELFLQNDWLMKCVNLYFQITNIWALDIRRVTKNGKKVADIGVSNLAVGLQMQ